MSKVFSSELEFKQISKVLTGYLKLPFSGDSIPGALMENVIATVKGGEVLKTYDFVDVISKKSQVGWQVKSTKASTPLTWKRAKIPNSQALIEASKSSDEGLQILGDAIISFCNDHAIESFNEYDLNEIGFARLIVHPDGKLTYYEKSLCTRQNPKIFKEEDFEWRWSTPKKTEKKEQLPALHGINRVNNKKWFAWHGLGENQLHFNGEKDWWPKSESEKIDFNFPKQRLTQKQLMDLLDQLSRIP